MNGIESKFPLFPLFFFLPFSIFLSSFFYFSFFFLPRPQSSLIPVSIFFISIFFSFYIFPLSERFSLLVPLSLFSFDTVTFSRFFSFNIHFFPMIFLLKRIFHSPLFEIGFQLNFFPHYCSFHSLLLFLSFPFFSLSSLRLVSTFMFLSFSKSLPCINIPVFDTIKWNRKESKNFSRTGSSILDHKF